MVDENEIDRALRKIASFTKKIGNSIQNQAEGQTDDGQPIEGYNIKHGNHNLNIVTVPGWEYFQIIYPNNYPRNIAIQREVNKRSKKNLKSGEMSIDIDQSDIMQATKDLKNHTKDFDLENIRYEFSREVSKVSSEAAVEIKTDGKLITGYQIKTKLFPYRDNFDIKEFEEKVQKTVNTGWIANEFLINFYNLNNLMKNEISQRSAESDPDMFQ